MSARPEPWDDWDVFVDEAERREREASLPDDRPTVRSRLVRGSIWFALAILPARERWIGWVLDGPPAIVQDHDGRVGEIPEIEVSLPSRP